MTSEEKEIRSVEKKITALMKTERWKKSLKKSDEQVSKTLEKLKLDSQVDPRLLDEPATL